MARRLYLGSKSAQSDCRYAIFRRFRSIGLPPDARSDEVAKFFDGYGRIVDCRVMTGDFCCLCCAFIAHSKLSGFGFVEFENSKVSSARRSLLSPVKLEKRSRTPRMPCIISMVKCSWARSEFHLELACVIISSL